MLSYPHQLFFKNEAHRPPRILLLSHKFHPDIGGIEINSELIAQSLHELGYEVHVLTWSKDSTGKVFPFVVIRQPDVHLLFREHMWADLIFENNPCIRLGWPNLFSKRPSIVTLNTWFNSSRDGQGWIKYQWIKRARNVISVSDAVRRGCWPTALVIRNPYRAAIFKILPDVNRSADFVFVGRLVSQKGVDLLLKAFHRLVYMMQKDKNLHLTIIGDGPERNNLERLVVDLHIEQQVVFVGFLRDDKLTNCLNQHKFLIVPSISDEAFGNVVLEGIACGCVPIVSNSGGLPEAAGNAGLVFKSGDLNDLAACMCRLQNDPDLVQKLREAAPNHLDAHHPHTVVQQYLQVIEAV